MNESFDVAIVGAGMAGLTCAQRLYQAGYRVVVVEKSRGLGGRLATRRLLNTHADHGVCYLKPKNERFKALLETLHDRALIKIWTDTIHHLDAEGRLQEPPAAERSPRYASPAGFTAIAKFLATGLTVLQNQRVETVKLIDQTWHLQFEQPSRQNVVAKSLLVAIPAPQAVDLLAALPDSELISQLKSVQFSPCISAIAVYPTDRLSEISALPWKAVVCPHDSDLAWVGLDSSKQNSAAQPVFVLQSTATFADRHLEAVDLQPVGQLLLNKAARSLLPWLAAPQLLQVHRWRYAFPTQPLAERFLVANTDLPLVCAGDWCGGDRVESAFLSGWAAAEHLATRLQARSLSGNPAQQILSENFWETISA